MQFILAKLLIVWMLYMMVAPAHAVVRGKPVHGLALYGEPKYKPDFEHFDYVNPDAPKGGEFTKTNEAYLTFDTLNPFTLKGAPAHGLERLLYDTLMTRGEDEPYSVYGLIAQTVEVAPDNSWVEFTLRPEAYFTDESPVTAEDVVFSFNTVVEKGAPQFRTMYGDVESVAAIDPQTVRFTFKTTANRKLPLLIGEFLPVISKQYWETLDFADTTLDIPVTNGPYVIESFEAGRHIIYRRWENYWGKNLPVNRGRFNFGHVRFEYFRDDDVRFEAFKTNGYDFVREVSARRWAIEYRFPAVQNGLVQTMEVSDIKPLDSQPIFLNLRRPVFQDRKVRQALNYAFDFESMNANLFYGQYVRSRSFWQDSPLEAKGLPDAAELELLEPLRGKIPEEVFTAEFSQPVTDGTGNPRDNLLKARNLLASAGWELKDSVLTNSDSGQELTFEILTRSPTSDRIYLPFMQNLKRLGIETTIRMVDTSQFINRLNEFDYDALMIVHPQNDLTPGNEQRENWGSQAADIVGSQNVSGVKDEAVDFLVEKIISAETYDQVTAATRALDRVLTWNYYVILSYTAPVERFAYWTRLKAPDEPPALGLDSMGESAIALWWADPNAKPGITTGGDNVESGPSAARDRLILALVIGAVFVIIFVTIRRRRANTRTDTTG